MLDLQSSDAPGVVGVLERLFYLGRSSDHLASRFAALHGEELSALAALRSRLPLDLARRGRALRLLGRLDEARACLDEAAQRSGRQLACALAWRWEAAAGPAPGSDLEAAVALEPEKPTWRLWLALARLDASRYDEALESAAAAAALGAGAPAQAVSGLVWRARGRPEQALSFLDAALAESPRLEWIYRLRAMARREAGLHEGCLEDCFQAMRLNEMVGTLFIPLGLYRGRAAAAEHIAAATRAIRKDPQAFWAYVYRSDYKRQPEINDNSGALADLERAASLAPGRAWTHAYLARAQTIFGDFAAAARSLDRAVELDGECGWIRAWRGEQMRRQGKLAEAASELDRAARLDPDYELTYAWRAGVLRQSGRPREALADLDKAIGLEPTNAAWCWFERHLAWRDLDRLDEALEDLARARRLNDRFVWESDPARFDAALARLAAHLRRRPRRAAARFWRGDILMRRRDYSAAARELSLALEAAPRDVEARVLRGRALGELGRWDEAFRDFDAAVSAEPDSSRARAWRGRALMLRGKLAEAAKDFARAVELDSGAAWVWCWKGETALRRGEAAAAERDLSRALEIHPRYADAFAWRGASRLKLGRAKEGRADLDRALELEPQNVAARALREGAPPVAAAPQDEPSAGAFAHARKLSRSGEHAAAAEAYTRLLKDPALREQALHERADAYRCLGRLDLALADRESLVALRRGEPGPLVNRGLTRLRLYDFAGARRDALAALRADERHAGAWVLRAEAERALGRFAEAARCAQRASRLEPRWSWAHVVRAKALRQKGELAPALAAAEQARRIADEPYAHAWRGEILRKIGRRREALAELSKARAAQPQNAWVIALMGELQRSLGRPEAGLRDLLEAFRLDPHASCAFDFLGAGPAANRRDPALAWVYAWRGGISRRAGRLDEAWSDLSLARALDGGCFWIAAWYGELLSQRGRLAEGVLELERSLKLFDGYSQAWIWLGQARLRLKDVSGAETAFARAAALDPRDAWAILGQAACSEAAGRAAQARRLLARARRIAPGILAEAA